MGPAALELELIGSLAAVAPLVAAALEAIAELGVTMGTSEAWSVPHVTHDVEPGFS